MSREGVQKWLEKMNMKTKKTTAKQKAVAIGAHTDSNYQAVAIMADWCGHCKKLKPKWKKLSGPFFTHISQSIDGDNPKGTETYFETIRGFPTIAIMKNGKFVTKDEDELKEMSASMRRKLRTIAQKSDDWQSISSHMEKHALDLVSDMKKKKKVSVQDLIDLTIGMNIGNKGSYNDTYGSENCGKGYGY